jgi:hypothetical protein
MARFGWPAAPAADTYSVARVLLSEIASTSYGDCVAPTQIANTYDDGEIPPAGNGFAYLIRGISSLCGNGTLGSGQDGLERRNLDPESCP